MPHANVWIRKKDEDRWEALENKSQFISDALNGAPTTIDATPSRKVYSSSVTKVTSPISKKDKIKPLLNIPGLTTADKLECSGDHYMNRKDCGRAKCPWKW